jgi:hypothetical protein
MPGKSRRGARLKLAGNKPILRAQQRAREPRRTGIDGQPAGRIAGRDRIDIGRKECTSGRSQRRSLEPGDAIAPFAAALRLLGGEVVAPSTGMNIDDAKRRRLAAQMHEDAREHRVFEHVGEISGVKGVPIVHSAQVMRANALL